MNDRFSIPKRFIPTLLVLLLPWCGSAQVDIKELPPIDSLSDWQVNALLQQYTAQARDFEALLSGKSQSASNQKSTLEETLNLAKADTTLSKSVTDSITNLLKVAKKDEKIALRNLGQAQKNLALMDKTAEADNDEKRKQLPKLRKQLEKTNALAYPVAPADEALKPEKAPRPPKVKKAKKVKAPQEEVAAEVIEDSTAPTAAPETAPKPSTKPQTATAPTKKYDPAQDVMLNPPALQCRLAVDTRDELSGERYRRTMPVELFRHSPAALKSYLQGKTNVQCAAALASSGAYVYLHLIFTINDPNPRKAFGKIDKESLATLKFIDGTSYNIYNQVASEGIQNPDTQAYTFQAQYLLPADALKKIRRSELDKIRIAWSSGYEDYEVQYVLLLMGQAKCLFDN